MNTISGLKLINNKNLHLTTSVIVVTIISLVYGLSPGNFLPTLFDFTVDNINLKQVFRAIMGLYIAMAILWTMGIFKPAYWRTATIANIFFMCGLAAGRIISLLADGIPSIFFCAGLAAELILAFWGINNLKKYHSQP